jgi:pseudouridine-5'-phosphate glycosidase/pseudouridine kinase
MLARRVLGRGLSTSTNQLAGLSRSLQLGAPIDVHPEVEHALQNHLPVVALESTIITHGMPYPTNLTTARSVENIVRSTGAIPATIGLVSGRIKIGLTSHELERLADVDQNKGVKLSRRDLGPAIAAKRDGGTTCSTTLIFAALAGIKVRPSLISSATSHTVLQVFSTGG